MSLERGIDAAIQTATVGQVRIRKGRVKKVDTTGTWDRVTIDPGGLTMVTMVAVSVDDVVMWLAGPTPVCLGVPYSTP